MVPLTLPAEPLVTTRLRLPLITPEERDDMLAGADQVFERLQVSSRISISPRTGALKQVRTQG